MEALERIKPQLAPGVAPVSDQAALAAKLTA